MPDRSLCIASLLWRRLRASLWPSESQLLYFGEICAFSLRNIESQLKSHVHLCDCILYYSGAAKSV